MHVPRQPVQVTGDEVLDRITCQLIEHLLQYRPPAAQTADLPVPTLASYGKNIANAMPAERLLTLEEGVDVVGQYRPDSSELDRQRLTYSFGFHPDVLEQACKYLSCRPRLGIAEMCRMVGKDVGLVLDTISARRSDSFMAACRSLVGDLAASAPASLKLLEMLAFASHVNVPVELASAYSTSLI